MRADARAVDVAYGCPLARTEPANASSWHGPPGRRDAPRLPTATGGQGDASLNARCVSERPRRPTVGAGGDSASFFPPFFRVLSPFSPSPAPQFCFPDPSETGWQSICAAIPVLLASLPMCVPLRTTEGLIESRLRRALSWSVVLQHTIISRKVLLTCRMFRKLHSACSAK